MSPRRGQYIEGNEGGDAQDFAFCLSCGCPFPHKEGTKIFSFSFLKACSNLLKPTARKHITCTTTDAHKEQNTARGCPET